MAVPDYGKNLHQLRTEWENCTACDLGPYRQSIGGAFVFGEGVLNSIMLIGEGPGETEEKEGRPFVGRSGQILRQVLQDLNMEQMVYVTNCVSCRSCSQAFGSEGQPIFRKDGKPRIVDQPTSSIQVQACSDRLYEEIYLVDPDVIVTLGQTASELLLRRPVSILVECGSVDVAKIPGGGWVPQLTEKRQQWRHKVRGEWVAPVHQNQVEYLCIPCHHPAVVAKNLSDRRKDAPPEQFVSALRLARSLYEAHMSELFGEQTPITK